MTSYYTPFKAQLAVNRGQWNVHDMTPYQLWPTLTLANTIAAPKAQNTLLRAQLKIKFASMRVL
jgi:hypothetical protein